VEQYRDLLSIALDHLSLGPAALYEAILEGRDGPLGRPRSPQRSDPTSHRFTTAHRELDAAVAGLRHANRSDFLPRGLLTRAWLRSLTGDWFGPESAQADLDEAWEIAERAPCGCSWRTFTCTGHGCSGGVGGVVSSRSSAISGGKYPWESLAADLAAAHKLIEFC
jgi:hypothetical protein